MDNKSRIGKSDSGELPARGGGPGGQPDNFFIWVGGNDRHEWDNMHSRLEDVEKSFQDRIHSIQEQTRRYHKKERRGKDYWYVWNDGSWKYVGPVNNNDPRQGLFKQISELETQMVFKLEQMKSCIVKELGDHLLINTDLFLEHVYKKLPDKIIQVRDVMSG